MLYDYVLRRMVFQIHLAVKWDDKPISSVICHGNV
jgi:hypothetical protein